MDELIKLVSQKAGISDSQATTAVETVMGFLKDNLPAPLDSQVEALLSGGEMPDVGDVGQMLGSLGKVMRKDIERRHPTPKYPRPLDRCRPARHLRGY